MTEQEQLVLDGVLRNEPFIGVYDGYAYFLGPASPTELDWQDAMSWCKSLGDEYELPTKEILNACWMNESIREEFLPNWYWSSTFYVMLKDRSCVQSFDDDDQATSHHTFMHCVRAVRKIKI